MQKLRYVVLGMAIAFAISNGIVRLAAHQQPDAAPTSAALPTISGQAFTQLDVVGMSPYVQVSTGVSDEGRAHVYIGLTPEAEKAIRRVLDQNPDLTTPR